MRTSVQAGQVGYRRFNCIADSCGDVIARIVARNTAWVNIDDMIGNGDTEQANPEKALAGLPCYSADQAFDPKAHLDGTPDNCATFAINDMTAVLTSTTRHS